MEKRYEFNLTIAGFGQDLPSAWESAMEGMLDYGPAPLPVLIEPEHDAEWLNDATVFAFNLDRVMEWLKEFYDTPSYFGGNALVIIGWGNGDVDAIEEAL